MEFENMEQLTNYDMKAGSLFREFERTMNGIKEKKEKSYLRDYCDYCLVIYPYDSGKGGTWVYFGKDYLDDEKCGIRFIDNEFDFIEEKKKGSTFYNNCEDIPMLKQKVKELMEGKRPYNFYNVSSSYAAGETAHKQNIKELREMISEFYPNAREITGGKNG